MTSSLRIGTRGSALALAQAGMCAGAITEATGTSIELVHITTHGDTSRESLSQIGGTGVFASALREALLAGECDAAVHSAKDLPTAPYPGLQIASVPSREDPRDALVARDGLTLHELGEGARIGTGSPRRKAQLLAMGLSCEIVDIRGNVDTRLGMVTSGELDAVVLARAGLLRLGRADVITEVLDPLDMLPAAGQGCLAVECREGDEEAARIVRSVHDEATAACLEAERSVLATLEMGCTAPIASLCEYAEGDDGPELFLRAGLAIDGGTDVLRRSMTGSPAKAQRVGEQLAQILREDGAIDHADTAHSTPAGDL